MEKKPDVTLTLYTRENCSLCEDMLHVLHEFSEDLNFSLILVDVDEDPQTKKKYNELVPVLKLGDEEICHHFYDHRSLLKTLENRQVCH